MRYKQVKANYRRILDGFAGIPMQKSRRSWWRGGRDFRQILPPGHNNLEAVLVDEGAEVVIPGLLDFCLYCVYNNILDHKLYGMQKSAQLAYRIACRFLLNKERI